MKVGRQVADMQDRSRTQRHGTFNGVFKLADITGPVVGHDLAHGVFRDGVDRAAGVRKPLKERIHQQRNIRLALPQRRQLDLDHIQAKE